MVAVSRRTGRRLAKMGGYSQWAHIRDGAFYSGRPP